MRYFYLDDPAGRSPLHELEQANRFPLERVMRLDQADIAVARRAALFTPETASPRRLNLVWTHEPYLSLEMVPTITVGEATVHLFNVYNGNVYTDNFFYSNYRTGIEPLRDEASLNVPFDRKTVATVMSGKRGTLMHDGVDVSFADRRKHFGTEGHRLGRVDVYGGGWPEGVSRGNSRQVAHRTNDKMDILRGYNFSCAFENTSWDYYTTEKLWESLYARTLPIYSKSSTIIQTFDPDALLMYADNAELEPLLARIDAMPFSEYRDRLNALIEAVNRLPRRELFFLSRARAQDRLLQFLQATSNMAVS